MACSKPETVIYRRNGDAMDRRLAVLRDINHYCSRYRPGEREVVLLLGAVGVGKSGVINTVAKPVNGEYFEIAPVGTGGGDAPSKTKELRLYPKCGLKMNLPRRNINQNEAELFESIEPYWPEIRDFAGLFNYNTPSLKEILEMLVGGYIPPKISIERLEEEQRLYGINCLKTIYREPRAEWKPTKIVFVHSCSSPVPTELVKCVLSVKFTGKIFVLITKYDLVNNTVGEEDFRRIREALLRNFVIEGALEYNSQTWINNCTETGFNDEERDLQALEFIRHIVRPTDEPWPLPPDTPWYIRLQLWLRRQLRDAKDSVNFNRRDLLVSIVAAVLVFCFCLIYFLLAQAPKTQ